MRVSKWLVITVVIAGIAVGGWLALRQIPASFGYGVCAEFDELPPTDTTLENWMAVQPGVAKVVVTRNGRRVGVMWVMVQAIGPQTPRPPDLRAAFERFGYRGPGAIDDYCQGN